MYVLAILCLPISLSPHLQSNGEVEVISKDALFANQEPADLLPDVILPQANLSSYITTEHGENRPLFHFIL